MWNSRQLQRYSQGSGSSTCTRGQPSEHLSVMMWLTPPGMPSLLGAIATRLSCRTPSTTSCLNEGRMSQDGDGTPPGRDGGAEHLSAGCSARDRVSLHLVAELRRHHPRVPEDGRGSGQRPLRRGGSSGQSLPLQIPFSLGATMSYVESH
jgi:hypothetical protein